MRLIVEIRGERREFALPEGTSVIGRDPACQICVAAKSLSRRHLQVELSGETLTVRDLESKNGTFVGQQRIHEARLQPGMRLRAGNVWMRFEREEASDTRQLDMGAEALESRVPDAPGFEPDDAPTPADEATAPSTAGEGSGTEMIVRDGRWFARDMATGVEVEVVPSASQAAEHGKAALPAVAAPSVKKPAAAVRRAEPVGAPRRGWALKISLIALFIALITLGLIFWLMPKKPAVQYLSFEEYQRMAAEAVEEYSQGHAEAAADLLRRIEAMPMEPRMELPHVLLAAFEADGPAHEHFEQNYEKAKDCWTAVDRSAETNVPSARDLARKRLLWLNAEENNLINLNEARQALAQRNFLKALKNALQIKEDSRFYKGAPDIIEQSTAQLKKEIADLGAAQNWTGAVAAMTNLRGVLPSLADEFAPDIARYNEYEEQRKQLEAARAEADSRVSGRAIAALALMPKDSPYAKAAALLLTEVRNRELLKQAEATYTAGDGPKALEILAKLPNADPDLVQRIKLVVAANAAAYDALKETEFATAMDKFNEILRLEQTANNRYVTDAKSRLEAMAKTKGAAAKELIKAADEAAQRRDFRVARRKYTEAQTLDPTDRGAAEGLKKLIEWAVRDYNRALIVAKDDPQAALQIFQEVVDRLPVDHPLTASSQMEILNLKLQLGRDPLKNDGKPADGNKP